MSVEKFSVSFDPDLGRQVRELAAAEDITVSAFLAEAAHERVRQLLLDRWLDDEAAHHKLSRAELLALGESLLAESTPAKPRRRPRTASSAASSAA